MDPTLPDHLSLRAMRGVRSESAEGAPARTEPTSRDTGGSSRREGTESPAQVEVWDPGESPRSGAKTEGQDGVSGLGGFARARRGSAAALATTRKLTWPAGSRPLPSYADPGREKDDARGWP